MVRRLLPLLLFALTVVTCAARRPKPLEVPTSVAEIVAQAPSDRAAAISTLEGRLEAGPDESELVWLLLHAGEQRRLAGDAEEARDWFTTLAYDHPTHRLKDPAVLGTALVDAEQSLSGNTLATLQLIGDEGVPRSMNADRYRVLARVAADEGTAPPKVRDLVRKAVVNAQGDPTVEARVRRSLDDLLEEEQASGLAEADGAGTAEERALGALREAIADRRLDDVKTDGARFLDAWPDSEAKGEVEALVRRAKAGDPINARKIGVLLPLTGDYAPAAARLRKVIELAAEGSGNTLVFKDTAGDPETAVAAFEALVLEDGVVTVLGPLTKEAVLATAPVAQDFRVPMVAMTQSASPTEVGDFIFRGFLPLEQQVEALARHGAQDRAFQRYAILHPTTPYGETARDLFKAEVEARGGEVVRVVSYDPTASDFLDAARELGQKDYEARASEFYRIKRDFEKRNIPVDKAMLPPIVDFDAVFIPDAWRRVALVASALAYEEFPVGGFRPNRHAEPIPLLGLNAWNDPRILEAGGQYVKYAVFVDAFLPTSNDTAVKSFVREYKTAFGRDPQVVDAVTWDATRFVTGAAAAGGGSREAVRDQLVDGTLDAPVSRGARFGEDREVARDLLLLTIDGKSIVPWVAPEEELPPEGLPAPQE